MLRQAPKRGVGRARRAFINRWGGREPTSAGRGLSSVRLVRHIHIRDLTRSDPDATRLLRRDRASMQDRFDGRRHGQCLLGFAILVSPGNKRVCAEWDGGSRRAVGGLESTEPAIALA
jgi:hypothetical protein